jgi:hypothetical protein
MTWPTPPSSPRRGVTPFDSCRTRTSTSAVLAVSVDTSCCVDVTDSDDEPVPYAKSSGAAARREQQAREHRTARQPTGTAVNDRMAHQSRLPALDGVDAPNTLTANWDLLESAGVFATISVLTRASRANPTLLANYTALAGVARSI